MALVRNLSFAQKLRRFAAATVVGFTISGSLANADMELQDIHKDWQAGEFTDPVLQAPVCRAWTSLSKGAVPVELSLTFPKNQIAPPYIQIRIPAQPEKKFLAAIQISSKETQLFFLQAAGAENSVNDSYLFSSVSFEKLVDRIRSQSSIDLILDPKGTPVSVRISLRGSSAAMKEVEKCLGQRDAVPSEFFQLLGEAIGSDLQVPPVISAEAFFQSQVDAYKHYVEGKKLQLSIDTLRKSVSALLKKEAAALKEYTDWQRRFDRADGALQEHKGKISSYETQILEAQQLLAQLKVDLGVAEKVQSEKLAIYEPLRKLFAPLQEKVREIRSRINSVDNRISDERSLISSNQSSISSMESELSRIRNTIPSLESDRRSLESDKRRVESDLFSYSIDRVKNDILRRDGRYDRARREADQARREISDSRNRVSQEQSRLRDLESQLRQCENQPRPPAELPTPENPNPPQPPAPDCSSQRSAVNSQESSVRQAEGQLREAERCLDRAEDDMRRAEDDAEREARDGYNRLVSIRDDLARRINSVEDQIDDLEARQRQIEISIPQMESEIAEARREISRLQNARAGLVSELNEAVRIRDEFVAANNYTAIENDYLASVKVVETIKENITGTERTIRKANEKLAQANKDLPGFVKDVEKVRPKRDSTLAALELIRVDLKPMREQEAILLAQFETEKTGFQTQKALYQGLMKELSDGTP